jgi:uncharacterized Rmd1/YagE family protein
MIKHIVAWNFPESEKSEIMQQMKTLLESLPALIPEIEFYEVGINTLDSEFAMDMILISGFQDQAALDTYSKHPEHQQVVKALGATGAERVVVDFEV